MEVLVALIEAIAKLAWPIVFFIIVWWFRDDVSRLLNRAVKAKFLGSELEFTVEQLKSNVRAVLESRIIVPSSEAQPAADEKPASTTQVEREACQKTATTDLGLSFLEEKIHTEPEVATILLASQIEKNLRDVLARRGINVYRSSMSKMGELAVRHLGYPQDFFEALMRFSQIRNMVVHSYGDVNRDELINVAQSGFQLLKHMYHHQTQPIFIQATSITAYLDENCTQVANNLEGIWLLFGAIPGVSGGSMHAVTDKVGSYSTGMEVTSEWHKMEEPRHVWLHHSLTGDIQRIDLQQPGVFRGRNIEEVLKGSG